MTTTETGASPALAGTAATEDSANNNAKTGSLNRPRHYVQHFPPQTPQKVNVGSAATAAAAAATVDDRDKASFYRDLYHFHEVKG